MLMSQGKRMRYVKNYIFDCIQYTFKDLTRNVVLNRAEVSFCIKISFMFSIYSITDLTILATSLNIKMMNHLYILDEYYNHFLDNNSMVLIYM